MPKINRPFAPQQPGAGTDNYIDGGPARAGLEELRGKVNAAPVTWGTVAQAEAASYTEPESVVVTETGRTYTYSASSEAARDGIRVLSPSGGGRLHMTAPVMTDAEVAAATRASSPSQSGLMSESQSAGVAFLLAGCFGGIHVHDATASQTIPSGSAYTKASCFTNNDPASNCSADAANDKITLTKTGYYKVVATASLSCSVNGILLKSAAFLDGVEQNNCHDERRFPANDVGSVKIIGIIDCTSANCDLDLRFAHDNDGSVDITVKYANLNVQWIGNT